MMGVIGHQSASDANQLLKVYTVSDF